MTATVGDESPTNDPESGAPTPKRRRFAMSIQSKLLTMLLGVSLLSALVVGYIGYNSGTDSLRDAAQQRLVQIRESRTREIEAYFQNLRDSVILDSQNTTGVQAANAFISAFDELNSKPVAEADKGAVTKFYDDTFVPQLEQRSQAQVDASALLPTTNAQWYLQAKYTAFSDDFDKKLARDDAGDGSQWSAAHAKYNPYYRQLVERLGYEDLFILDTKGNVVYSAYQGVDLGTNIETGPYRGGGFQKVYNDSLHSNQLNYIEMSDLERYQPSLGVPTGFMASPIGAGGKTVGVLVIQIPMDRVNGVMTGNNDWKADGLGDTGETYLVGPDQLMRSTSRRLLESPKTYAELAIAAGVPAATANRMVQVKGTVLLQPVKTAGVAAALRGKSGVTAAPDYLGEERLSAYGPLNIPGVQWVMVANLQESEAYAPVTTFAKNLAISTAGLILLVCLASLLLAQVFTRPLRRLLDAVRKVAGGDLQTQVPVTSHDEFGQLGSAFNDMSRSLRTRAELLEEQQAENQQLLLSLMPADVAERYREGEETIAKEQSNVAVIFADVAGLDTMTSGLSSSEALARTNQLVRGFEEAAQRTGMEKVRVMRNGYLASCGLVIPRLDNARRTVEFAREMQAVISLFNAQHDVNLALRAGIDTGTVASGLVGPSNVVYDMWGDAVDLAYQIRAAGGQPGIFVSSAIYDRLRTEYQFTQAGSTRDGAQVWTLVDHE